MKNSLLRKRIRAHADWLTETGCEFTCEQHSPLRMRVSRHAVYTGLLLLIFPMFLVVIGSMPSVAVEPAPRFEFTRLVAHWDAYGDAAYLPFIDEVQPEVAQVGFYGAHFWSLVHTPVYGGYPAHFPVRGIEECGAWFEQLNRELHRRNVKVVGHFNVEFLVGDPDGPEGPRGFFKFYRDLWDEKQLGPKPVADPMQLLERGPDGKPISQSGYGIGGMHEYWACLRNPHWQQVLKAWTKRGIERGVDGYMINYFYRHNCLCEHCQLAFRKYLAERFTPAQLKEQLGIEQLDTYRFKELVSWHDPKESTPLRREMLRFSQVSNKQVFDEVFIRYGRSLKPDLIVGQWNHLGNFSQINGDERCLLPGDLWGRDETYLWYSTGDHAYYTDLEKRFLGEGTLQARYLRGAFDDKPFTLGKYESTRTRVAIAELAANGGAPMGFYTRFTDPEARAEMARYYQFLRRYDDLFKANRSHAEAVLLFPRTAVHRGDLAALDRFRQLGQQLLEAHVLFDVLPDDLGRVTTPDTNEQSASVTADRWAAYRHVIRTEEKTDPAVESWGDTSRFTAPFTVRVSASRPRTGHDLVLHFVNYDRDEPPKQDGKPSPGSGIRDEKPRPVRDIRADLVLPTQTRVVGIEAMSPEHPNPIAVPFEATSGHLRFTVPEFLVYRLIRIQLEQE